MKTLFCILLLASSFVRADSITVNVDPALIPGVQLAADGYNATAKQQFDAATKVAFERTQAALPVADRVAYDPAKVVQYTPLTWKAYYAWRAEQVAEGYNEALVAKRIADSKALIDSIARLPDAQRLPLLQQLQTSAQ